MTEQTEIRGDAVAVHKTIAAALASAQVEMTRAQKSAENPHLKRKYADLAAVCDASMPALNRHGIAVVQRMQADGDAWTMLTVFVHADSGETLETPVPLIFGKKDMQGLGSAMTYARRYGLMALAGIAPEDDDGHGAVVRDKDNAPRIRDNALAARQEADRIVTAINQVASLDALGALWRDRRDLLSRIRTDNPAAYAEIEAAKNTRKETLTPAPDLGDDTIPF